MLSNIITKKCGVRFKPPAIILYYEDKEASKLHERIMPLHDFNENSNVKLAIEELRDKHKQYLCLVSNLKLEKLARIIQENMKGLTMKDILSNIEKEFSVDPNEDLNKVDEDTLQRKKDIMNEIFEANRIKPGDPDFLYDVEVDFHQPAIESSEWDSDKDEPIF